MPESGSKLPPKLSPDELSRPVPRKVVGPPVARPSRPEPEANAEPEPFKSDPAWDKLLLVIGAALVVIAILVVPGLLERGGKNPVAEAAEATMQYPGARMTVTGSGGVAGASVSIQGSGVMNGDADRAQFQMNMTGAGQAITINEVVDGTDIYMHMPQLSQLFGGGKAWLLIRGEAFGDAFKQSGGLGQGSSTPSDPQQQLEMLESASSDVESVGQEQIDGVTTTHYTAVIDVQKLLDDMRDQLPDGLADAMDESLGGDAQEIVHVWIDDQGLIRRESADMTLGAAGSFNMTMNFSDFGIHPQINVPPPQLVQDITPMLEQGLDQLQS